MDVAEAAQRAVGARLVRAVVDGAGRVDEYEVSDARGAVGRIERDYADPDAVRAHYRRWFEHLGTRPGSHLVVDLEGEARVAPIADFEALAAGAA